MAVAESENIRAYTYKLLNAMDGAVSELKNYRELVSVFESIMMNQRKDSQKGREEMMETAIKRIRKIKA